MRKWETEKRGNEEMNWKWSSFDLRLETKRLTREAIHLLTLVDMIVPTNLLILVYILMLQSLLHHYRAKEVTIFVINFVVIWKPGLNDLIRHVTFNILFSGLACKIMP